MSIGKLVQEVYLVALPENCNFTVTELETKHKVRDSFAFFETTKKPPYEVTFTSAKVKLATSILGTTSTISSGQGLSNTLRFTVSGNINNKSFKKEGTITVSSTEWPRIGGRPDHSVLTYIFDGSNPVSISQQTPTLINPDPYYIAFSINKDNQIYMIVSREDNLGTKLMSGILDGIFTIHTAGLKWAFGKIF